MKYILIYIVARHHIKNISLIKNRIINNVFKKIRKKNVVAKNMGAPWAPSG